MSELTYIVTVEVILWLVVWMFLSGAVITIKRLISFYRRRNEFWMNPTWLQEFEKEAGYL